MELRPRAILLASCLSLFACDRVMPPPLVQVTELVPTEAEVGDNLVLRGSSFPAGMRGRVLFRGTLFRPGEDPVPSAEVETHGVAVTPTEVSIPFTEELQARFARGRSGPTHTTWRGDVTIAFPSRSSTVPPVSGHLSSAVLDIKPPEQERSRALARRKAAEDFLTSIGITVRGGGHSRSGLWIEAIVPGSAAERASLRTGDVVTQVDGVRATSIDDVVPRPHARQMMLATRRGDELREVPRVIDLSPTGILLPEGWRAAWLVTLCIVAVGLLRVAPRPRMLLALELAWLRDLPRLLEVRTWAKRMLRRRPTSSDFAWILGLLAVVATPSILSRSTLQADVVVATAIVASVSTAFALMRGGLLGLRSVAPWSAFALPLGAVATVLEYRSVRLFEIVDSQGGLPWEFYGLHSPAGFVAMGLSLLAARNVLALSGAGANVPVGSTSRVVLAVLLSVWLTLLFLGGYKVPLLASVQLQARAWLWILSALLFLAKVSLLSTFLLLVSTPSAHAATRGRLALFALVPPALAAAWIHLAPSRAIQSLVASSLAAMALYVAVGALVSALSIMRGRLVPPRANVFL